MPVHPLRTWIFGGFCLLLVIVVFTYQSITPSDGARIDKGQEAWTSRGIHLHIYDLKESGLKDSDLLVAVNDVSIASLADRLFQLEAAPLEWKAGQPLTYQVIRDGQTLEISIIPSRQPIGSILAAHWGVLLFAGVTQVLGIFVFLRRPKDPAAATIFIWGMTCSHFYVWTLYRQIPDILNGYGFWLYTIIGSFLWLSNWATGVQLALTFPRPLPALLKRPQLFYLPYFVIFTFFLGFISISRGFTSNTLEWIDTWGQGESLSAILMFVPMVSFMIHQYLSASAESNRKKIRLVVFSVLITGNLSILFYLLPPLLGQPALEANFVGVFLLVFPASLAVAILRYQLFDIDVVIRRTLIYSSLTFSLVLVYFSSVVVIQQVFRSITGQVADSQAAIVLSTLVIAALFNPARRRIQGFIDRQFFRRRYDIEHTLEGFATVLREEVDIDSLSDHLLSVVEETVQPETVSLWLVNRDRREN